MQAMEIERSPGLPSLSVTTRRRLMPHGTSFSFLQAVTQALHSMQRSASQRNFIRAMSVSSRRPDLAERRFGFLHAGHRIVSISHNRICAFSEHVWIQTLRIPVAKIDALVPTAEMERHPGDTFPDALGDQRLHLGFGAILRPGDPDPDAVLDPALGRIRRTDLDKHVLLQLKIRV